MKTNNTITPLKAKLLLLAAVLLIPVLIASCTGENEISSGAGTQVAPPPPPPPPVASNQDEPYTEVDEMPVFPGGNDALLKYIRDHISYPEKAKEAGVTGRVVVRFAITRTGPVNRVSIIKGVSPEIDAEALRVVSALPDFVPGKKDGTAVDVWYLVPIHFALK